MGLRDVNCVCFAQLFLQVHRWIYVLLGMSLVILYEDVTSFGVCAFAYVGELSGSHTSLKA